MATVEYRVTVFPHATEWRNLKGKLHREGGPAIEWVSGAVAYWQNDLRHRDDGPAIVYPDGQEEYWVNGKRHCETGPAIRYPDRPGKWYLNGVKCSSAKEHLEKLKELKSSPCTGKVITIDGKKYRLQEI